MNARQPVVIGVGQLTNRAGDPSQVMEPLAMMAEVARRAAADAGIAITGLHWLLVKPDGLSITSPDPAYARKKATATD